LADKVAVVAGGARGLGAATAERLAAEGARVVVGDIEADGAKATAARIEAAGGTALAVAFDIVDEASVRALIAAAVDGFGGVDLLHNVAADLSDRTLRRDTDAVDIDVAVWDRTMTVNLRGFLLTIKAAVPEMLRRGGGAIVNTSSAASFMGEAQRPAYAVAKAGVNALTRHVAGRWGKENIRCNTVAPGVILTEALRSGPDSSELQRRILKAVRVPRLGEPDDIASMVAYLLSDEAGYINGQVLSVDGGITMR
jgi:NAD(P)-dependent dehydrogenase (short-subunit alcohol dehydrogenase family)